MDVLASGGLLGARPDPSRLGAVEAHFSCGDLVWANDWPAPRLGQGAFGAALRAVYREVTGGHDLGVTMYGKPMRAPYALAEAALAAEAARVAAATGEAARGEVAAIYTVGDNPRADIAGARAAGAPWVPLLVLTGVHPGPDNCGAHPGDAVLADVEHAVAWACARH